MIDKINASELAKIRYPLNSAELMIYESPEREGISPNRSKHVGKVFEEVVSYVLWIIERNGGYPYDDFELESRHMEDKKLRYIPKNISSGSLGADFDFEEEYQFCQSCHSYWNSTIRLAKWEGIVLCLSCWKNSIQKNFNEFLIKYEDKNKVRFSVQEREKLDKLFRLLIEERILGRYSKTCEKPYSDSIILIGKPDLIDKKGNLYELKVYPLTDFCREQARVFAWIFNKEIKLIGFKNENNEVKIQKEFIEVPINIGPISKEDIDNIKRLREK